MNYFQLSSKGPRAENQDYAAVLEFSHNSALCCIADGVGGHNGGQVASKEAVKFFTELVQQNTIPLVECALQTHNAISLLSQSSIDLAGMATTLSAVFISGDTLTGIHCGDSRIYLLRGNGIKQLTEDQTEVMRLIKQGKITREDAIDYPRKNVLYSAIGGQKTPEFQAISLNIQSGDRIILTTDGAHNFITKKLMRDMSLSSNSVELLTKRLEQHLLLSDLNDNYTIVAIQI